jgi:hypothetical protein
MQKVKKNDASLLTFTGIISLSATKNRSFVDTISVNTNINRFFVYIISANANINRFYSHIISASTNINVSLLSGTSCNGRSTSIHLQ